MLPDAVLIRGSARSGTTMLADTLNASPQAAILVEYPLSHLLRDLDPIFAYGDGMAAAEQQRAQRAAAFAAGTAPANAFLGAGSMLRPRTAFPRRAHKAQIAAGIIAQALEKSAPAIVGSKTPGAYALDDDLRAAARFARTRVLFTMREPRATVNSMMNRRNLANAGLDSWQMGLREGIASYRASLRMLTALSTRMKSDLFVVDFDEMNAQRTASCSALGDFLGIAIPAEFPPGTVAMQQNRARRDVLAPDESAQVEAAFPDVGWGRQSISGRPDAALAIAGALLEPVRPGERRTFTPLDGAAPLLALGWSDVRDGSVWSIAERADLVITVDTAGSYTLELELQRMAPPAEQAAVTIRLDGIVVLTIGADTALGTVRTPELRLQARTAHVIEIAVDRLQNPARLGTSPEDRDFGILLHGITVRNL